MTTSPKEAAKKLYDKYQDICRHYNFTESHGWELDVKESKKATKAASQLCIQEIIEVLEQIHKPEYCIFIESYNPPIAEFNAYEKIDYYKEILTAINEL